MSAPAITTGGYSCAICSQFIPNGVAHFCGGAPAASNQPVAPVVGGFVFRAAWTCPVCGNGCAPWLDVCPGPHPTTFGGSETRP